ncbi:MAG: glycosyltransferase [Chthoniobacteraceae bacterium]
MQFSIVTPSFRQPGWLKRCIRSVADQQGVTVEHIIQDAGTGPELEEWVRQHSSAQLFVEKDRGMYDAINRGFARATGEFCAYLNCDEQYLPGALAGVAEAFRANPDADAVAADFLVIDPQNQLISFRKVTPLRRSMILSDHLYAFTCGIFFRRRILDQGIRFNPELATVADAEWVCELLARGHRFALLHRYTSAFVFTGENLSANEQAAAERAAILSRLSPQMRLAAPALRLLRHFEKLLAGGYHSGPISYEIYGNDDATTRTRFTCEKPGFRYPEV